MSKRTQRPDGAVKGKKLLTSAALSERLGIRFPPGVPRITPGREPEFSYLQAVWDVVAFELLGAVTNEFYVSPPAADFALTTPQREAMVSEWRVATRDVALAATGRADGATDWCAAEERANAHLEAFLARTDLHHYVVRCFRFYVFDWIRYSRDERFAKNLRRAAGAYVDRQARIFRRNWQRPGDALREMEADWSDTAPSDIIEIDGAADGHGYRPRLVRAVRAIENRHGIKAAVDWLVRWLELDDYEAALKDLENLVGVSEGPLPRDAQIMAERFSARIELLPLLQMLHNPAAYMAKLDPELRVADGDGFRLCDLDEIFETFGRWALLSPMVIRKFAECDPATRERIVRGNFGWDPMLDDERPLGAGAGRPRGAKDAPTAARQIKADESGRRAEEILEQAVQDEAVTRARLTYGTETPTAEQTRRMRRDIARAAALRAHGDSNPRATMERGRRRSSRRAPEN